MVRVLLVSLLFVSAWGAPCESPTTEAPCPTTTTAIPCLSPTTTVAPCPIITTTEAPTTTRCPTTTTTTEAPCTTTTTTEAPCTTTTVATTTLPCLITVSPCEDVTTTTTASPCTTTTTTVTPCHVDPTTPAPCNGGAAKTTTVSTVAPIYINYPANEEVCRDGWTRFKNSCYYVERENKATLQEAEAKCLERDASLFVMNSEEELKAIFEKVPFNSWTWLGLRKGGEEKEPRWQVADSANHTELNWLVKPYGDAVNGWSSASECAAYWNPSMDFGKYTFYYPCTYDFYYVCERNSTLHAGNYAKLH